MSELGHELGLLNKQLEELERHLNRLENKMFELLRLYVDAKMTEQFVATKEAMALADDVIRKANYVRVRERRASFKVIGREPPEREKPHSNGSPPV